MKVSNQHAGALIKASDYKSKTKESDDANDSIFPKDFDPNDAESGKQLIDNIINKFGSLDNYIESMRDFFE